MRSNDSTISVGHQSPAQGRRTHWLKSSSTSRRQQRCPQQQSPQPQQQQQQSPPYLKRTAWTLAVQHDDNVHGLDLFQGSCQAHDRRHLGCSRQLVWPADQIREEQRRRRSVLFRLSLAFLLLDPVHPSIPLPMRSSQSERKMIQQPWRRLLPACMHAGRRLHSQEQQVERLREASQGCCSCFAPHSLSKGCCRPLSVAAAADAGDGFVARAAAVAVIVTSSGSGGTGKRGVEDPFSQSISVASARERREERCKGREGETEARSCLHSLSHPVNSVCALV